MEQLAKGPTQFYGSGNVSPSSRRTARSFTSVVPGSQVTLLVTASTSTGEVALCFHGHSFYVPILGTESVAFIRCTLL